MYYKFYEKQAMTSFYGHCIFTIHDLMDAKDWNPPVGGSNLNSTISALRVTIFCLFFAFSIFY